MVTTIHTLVFLVPNNLTQLNPIKIDMILKATTPNDNMSLGAFVSLLQYCRKMPVHLLHVCHSLYQLTSPNTVFISKGQMLTTTLFLAVKDRISKKNPNTCFDPTKETSVYFGASKFVCGILLQLRRTSCFMRFKNFEQRTEKTSNY